MVPPLGRGVPVEAGAGPVGRPVLHPVLLNRLAARLRRKVHSPSVATPSEGEEEEEEEEAAVVAPPQRQAPRERVLAPTGQPSLSPVPRPMLSL